jgi:hypothetical protein
MRASEDGRTDDHEDLIDPSMMPDKDTPSQICYVVYSSSFDYGRSLENLMCFRLIESSSKAQLCAFAIAVQFQRSGFCQCAYLLSKIGEIREEAFQSSAKHLPPPERVN